MKPYRINVSLTARFDYLLPPENMAERAQRDQSQAWLDARLYEIKHEVEERIEKILQDQMKQTE